MGAFDPSMLMDILQKQGAQGASAPDTPPLQPPPMPQSGPSPIADISQPTGGQIPQSAANNAAMNPQQNQRIQGIKGYLANILYQGGEGMKSSMGMETDAQKQQRMFTQNVKTQELQNETQKTNSAIQLQQAQMDQMRSLVQVRMPDGTVMTMPYGLAIKTYPSAIAGQSKIEATKLANQGKVDLQTLKGQSPLIQAQARVANATADLKDAMNDPDSPAFGLAMQKVQWANYYKQKSLDMQNQRLSLQREGLDFREYGPTSSIRTQGQMSSALLDHVGKIGQEIASLGSEGKLGPLSGRFNEFMTGKVGSGDPAYTELRTDLGLFQTALMKAHVGSRGSEMMMQHFQGLIDSGKMTPETLNAALSSIKGYLNTYVKEGQFVPPNRDSKGAPTPPAPQKQWNAVKGIYE